MRNSIAYYSSNQFESFLLVFPLQIVYSVSACVRAYWKVERIIPQSIFDAPVKQDFGRFFFFQEKALGVPSGILLLRLPCLYKIMEE